THLFAHFACCTFRTRARSHFLISESGCPTTCNRPAGSPRPVLSVGTRLGCWIRARSALAARHQARRLARDGEGGVMEKAHEGGEERQWPTGAPRLDYGMTAFLEGKTLDEARAIVTAALKEEGFGVLTEIDVRATLKQKLGHDF